jgi:GT2 family glycosyltransferase
MIVFGVVLYNTKIQYLTDLLDSFAVYLAQNDRKLVLLDNCSTALGYAELLKNITNQDKYKSFVELIYSDKNLGFGGGHNYIFNYVIRNYSMNYYCICNPDVVFIDSSFNKLSDFIESNYSVAMVAPKILNTDLSLQFSNKKFPNIFNLLIRRFIPNFISKMIGVFEKIDIKYERRNDGYFNNNLGEFLSGCFLLIRSEVYKKINGFDERFFLYMEDVDLCKRVSQIGKIYFVSDAVVTHKWSRSSHKSFRSMMLHIKSAIKYFNKHGWL